MTVEFLQVKLNEHKKLEGEIEELKVEVSRLNNNGGSVLESEKVVG